MAGRIPKADAALLRTATLGGAVCLGKTHLSEIAFSGLGLNPVTATPPNRNDPEAVPGGSSSGAAASVAFGLAAGAIGSDTGGSVRVPAAWNDLVGFKPAHGRLPLTGSVALCETFDAVGPLARSVEDAALLFAALAGEPEADLAGARLEGTRLAVMETVVCEDLEPAPAAAFEAAVARLAEAGARVERIAWEPLREAFALTAPLYTGDAWSSWRELVTARGGEMFHHIRARVSAGAEVSAADYLLAWRKLRGLRADYLARHAGFDAVLCPTAPLLPPKVARLLEDDDYYVSANLATLRNTRLGNLMGLAALSLPTGTASCGLMLNVPPGHEARLLRLGAAAEAALA